MTRSSIRETLESASSRRCRKSSFILPKRGMHSSKRMSSVNVALHAFPPTVSSMSARPAEDKAHLDCSARCRILASSSRGSRSSTSPFSLQK